jgi:hypothetical protein
MRFLGVVLSDFCGGLCAKSVKASWGSKPEEGIGKILFHTQSHFDDVTNVNASYLGTSTWNMTSRPFPSILRA